ncbi:alcohol dehydrogenase superfamily protein [Mycena pura]|uniref:Alcohol dehydrogenase superfamily protein n=1 Tax=Mycena pura TaxID=153505 RepID=A0AAD6UZ12_9AGAR|nr:alcohol dehydrogenase superfamily protein [Mycena pura]
MSLPATARQYSYPQLGSFNNLVIQDVPVAAPKANQVLVKVHAVSLQFRDLMVASERYPGSIPTNLVPCSDMAGEVVSVGEDAKPWKTGDRLHKEQTPEISASSLGGQSQGVLVEYRSFPAHSLVSIPSHLTYEEASTLPCAALTAYNALVSGYEQVKAGDTVLIQGTGGVSIFALQFAVASGATCIVLSSSDEKLKTATKLGATHVINYKTNPDWHEEVLKLTNDRGVDRVVEVVGNATLGQSASSSKMGGSIDIIGHLGSAAGNVPAFDIIRPSIGKQLNIRGVFVGSVAQFKDMNRLLSAHPETTRPVIDRVFPFEDARGAFAHLQSQAHVGKVVIKVSA